MPCPFTGPKIFCARPKMYLHTVAVTFFATQKDDLHSVKLVFVPAQTFLGPVKGQGINLHI